MSDLQGPHFSPDRDADVLYQAREKEADGAPTGWSNKARDIESSLGYRP